MGELIMRARKLGLTTKWAEDCIKRGLIVVKSIDGRWIAMTKVGEKYLARGDLSQVARPIVRWPG